MFVRGKKASERRKRTVYGVREKTSSRYLLVGHRVNRGKSVHSEDEPFLRGRHHRPERRRFFFKRHKRER